MNLTYFLSIAKAQTVWFEPLFYLVFLNKNTPKQSDSLRGVFYLIQEMIISSLSS